MIYYLKEKYLTNHNFPLHLRIVMSSTMQCFFRPINKIHKCCLLSTLMNMKNTYKILRRNNKKSLNHTNPRGNPKCNHLNLMD